MQSQFGGRDRFKYNMFDGETLSLIGQFHSVFNLDNYPDKLPKFLLTPDFCSVNYK